MGLFDNPVMKQVPDVEGGYAVAQSIAEKSIVLLKNEHNVLPLEARCAFTRRADWRPCRCGRAHGRRVGTGGCAGRLSRSSASAGTGPVADGEFLEPLHVAAQFTAARVDGQTSDEQSYLCFR